LKQGCDASILLKGDGIEPIERNHTSNFGLRDGAIQAIEDIRAIIRAQCPRVVSCADILVIAAREAVRQVIIFIFIFCTYVAKYRVKCFFKK
jgi:peroxidase